MERFGKFLSQGQGVRAFGNDLAAAHGYEHRAGKVRARAVKTDREVLKSNIFLVMEKIRAAYVDSDTEIGTVILADVDGEGTNVVAAKPYRAAGEN